MRRAIIDYKRLDRELSALLIESYPYGYGDDDVLLLKKPNGDLIEVVELRTSDTIYLVKISKSLSNFISNFNETIEKEIEKIALHGEEDNSGTDQAEIMKDISNEI